LGDLDGDSAIEVIVGSADGSVYAWHRDGAPAAGWVRATGGEVRSSSPALGDLDGDGLLDVVVGATDGKVYAWHGDGRPMAGWPQTTGGAVHSSPALGDVDQDGAIDVVVGSYDGNVYAWHADGTAVDGWPRATGGEVHSSPALADLDRDGLLDVVVGSGDGRVYAWLGVAATDRIAPWPMFRHDKFHTGNHRTGPFPDVPSDSWACDEIEACLRAGIVAGYPDGLYHPEYPVTRDQMAVYISRALAGGDENVPEFADTPTFPDVGSEHWALDYVEYAVSQNVVAGYGDGSYHPEHAVTRDQMTVYVARAMLAPVGEAALVFYVPADPRNFPDAGSGFWAYAHIEYCVENGVVGGYGDGLYHPERIVTRDQMAVYVARAFELPT
jgi:hypothetical protein